MGEVPQDLQDNEIPEDRWASLLYTKLEGDAEKTVSVLGEDRLNSLDDLLEVLNKRFVKVRDREDASLALEARKQKQGENVNQYGQALVDLAMAAYPTDCEERRKQILKRMRVSMYSQSARSRIIDYMKANRDATVEAVIDELAEHDPLHVPGGVLKDGTPVLAVTDHQ